MLTSILHLLPTELQHVLGRLPEPVCESLEEIRIREGRPLEIGYNRGSHFADEEGRLHNDPDNAYKPTADVCRKLLERITNHSLYAMEEELRRGYITVAGGHRIGLAGRTVLENGKVRGIRDVGGFNVRIAREVVGASDGLLPKLLDRRRQTLLSTLIVGPPQQGKTTLIRDLARAVSYGRWGHAEAANWNGKKVGIVDERSEIAACVRGIPTFDVGPRTDILDACPKADGMMMMLRSLSPELLVVDEIGRAEDAEAIMEASHAGVAVLATAHAFDMEDAKGRPLLKKLMEEGAFDVGVVIRRVRDGLSCRVVPLHGRMQVPGAPSIQAPYAGNARGQPSAANVRASLLPVERCEP